MKLTFLSPTKTVASSKYLLNTGTKKILVECGLFQGPKEMRLKNWHHLPLNAHEIDSVIVTHAHIDHTGYTNRH